MVREDQFFAVRVSAVAPYTYGKHETRLERSSRNSSPESSIQDPHIMMPGQDSLESVKSAASAGSISPELAHGEPLDGAFARRVVRKIDRVLMPLMFVTYCLNFADKTVLSSASVFGLSDDTVRPFLSSSLVRH